MSELQAAINDLKQAPKTDIKGRGYSTVATRIEVFRKHFGLNYGVATEMLDSPEPDLVRVRATICDLDGRVYATGMAEENRRSSNINKTSALENCETSAIGRALAAFGLHGGEYATANETQAAMHQEQQAPAEPTEPNASNKRVRVETPEGPGHIPVPKPGDGQDMDQVWRAWGAAYKACLSMAEDVSQVNTWERENETPLKSLKSKHPKWEAALRDYAEQMRGQLAQQPVKENA